MELRQIIYFLKVAETLHYGRAARELGVTSQPLSSQIKKLEEELGYELFWRTTRSVRITPAGEAFREHAAKAMAELEAAVKAGELAETLTISCNGSPSLGTLSKILSDFSSKHPKVRVSLIGPASHEAADVEVIEVATRNGGATAGIMLDSYGALVAVREDCETARVRESLDACTPEGLPLIAVDRATSPAAADLQEMVARDLGLVGPPSATAESSRSALALVAAGAGECIIDERYLRELPEGVVALPVGTDARIDVMLAWDESRLSPIATEFIGCARRFLP